MSQSLWDEHFWEKEISNQVDTQQLEKQHAGIQTPSLSEGLMLIQYLQLTKWQKAVWFIYFHIITIFLIIRNKNKCPDVTRGCVPSRRRCHTEKDTRRPCVDPWQIRGQLLDVLVDGWSPDEALSRRGHNRSSRPVRTLQPTAALFQVFNFLSRSSARFLRTWWKLSPCSRHSLRKSTSFLLWILDGPQKNCICKKTRVIQHIVKSSANTYSFDDRMHVMIIRANISSSSTLMAADNSDSSDAFPTSPSFPRPPPPTVKEILSIFWLIFKASSRIRLVASSLRAFSGSLEVGEARELR